MLHFPFADTWKRFTRIRTKPSQWSTTHKQPRNLLNTNWSLDMWEQHYKMPEQLKAIQHSITLKACHILTRQIAAVHVAQSRECACPSLLQRQARLEMKPLRPLDRMLNEGPMWRTVTPLNMFIVHCSMCTLWETKEGKPLQCSGTHTPAHPNRYTKTRGDTRLPWLSLLFPSKV